LNGYRKKAMGSYVTYLEKLNYRKIEGKAVENPFHFALGKEWREIRDIFQYHLIMHHKNQSISRETFLSELGMKSSTYYTLQGKLKKRGFVIPGIKETNISVPEEMAIEPLNHYIRNTLSRLNWEEANHRFEKDIFLYLYQQCGFQKNRLGAALNLSAPIIRAKTDDIIASYGQTLNR